MTITNDAKQLTPSSSRLTSKSLEQEKSLWHVNHEDYANTTFSLTFQEVGLKRLKPIDSRLYFA